MGFSFFQGCYIGVTFQLKDKYVFYMIGQHYMAQGQILLFKFCHIYPWWFNWKTQLWEQWFIGGVWTYIPPTCEHNGLSVTLSKIRLSGQPHMLEPLKCVMVEYKTLIVKLWQNNVSIVQVKFKLDFLCDLHILMGLSYFMPLLEAVNVLIKFAQGGDVFICDFVTFIKICQTKFYMVYSNP